MSKKINQHGKTAILAALILAIGGVIAAAIEVLPDLLSYLLGR